MTNDVDTVRKWGLTKAELVFSEVEEQHEISQISDQIQNSEEWYFTLTGHTFERLICQFLTHQIRKCLGNVS